MSTTKNAKKYENIINAVSDINNVLEVGAEIGLSANMLSPELVGVCAKLGEETFLLYDASDIRPDGEEDGCWQVDSEVEGCVDVFEFDDMLSAMTFVVKRLLNKDK